MLVYVNIKNYKSIVDISLDMRYGERKAPNGYMQKSRYPFLQDSQVASPENPSLPLRVVPTLAIYGANACGKSTIVEALQEMIGMLWWDNCDDKLPIWKPNRLHPELNISEFTIQFTTEGKLYEYSFSYDNAGVRHEMLKARDAVIFELNHDTHTYSVKAIATPDYPEQRIQAIIDTECRDTIGTGYRLFFRTVARRYPGLNADIKNAYVYLGSIYTCTLVFNRMLTPFALDALVLHQENESRNTALQEMMPYIRKFDMDIIDMEFADDKKAKSDNPCGSLCARHRCADGSTALFPFHEESNGTQVLFGLLGFLLRALKTGSVAIIDEIDQSIHPHLLAALIRLFTDKENNPKGAQLIFTAHNTEPLAKEQLRVSEVGIVTKNLKDGTVVRRLCDYRGVRNVHDFQSMYLNGHFSGIPFPEI